MSQDDYQKRIADLHRTKSFEAALERAHSEHRQSGYLRPVRKQLRRINGPKGQPLFVQVAAHRRNPISSSVPEGECPLCPENIPTHSNGRQLIYSCTLNGANYIVLPNRFGVAEYQFTIATESHGRPLAWRSHDEMESTVREFGALSRSFGSRSGWVCFAGTFGSVPDHGHVHALLFGDHPGFPMLQAKEYPVVHFEFDDRDDNRIVALLRAWRGVCADGVANLIAVSRGDQRRILVIPRTTENVQIRGRNIQSLELLGHFIFTEPTDVSFRELWEGLASVQASIRPLIEHYLRSKE